MIRMKHGGCRSALLLALLAALLPGSLLAGEAADVAVARQYAELLDSGDYAAAWSRLDRHSRQCVDQELWLRQQAAVRDAYGPLLRRQEQGMVLRESYSLHPDGTYVLVSFASSFARKAVARETVVLRREADGTLAVIAYVSN